MTKCFHLLPATLCILVLLGCQGLLPAQHASGKPSVNFSCVIWQNLSIPELFYRDGEAYLPLELHVGSRSELYVLKQSDTLELYVPSTDGNASNTDETRGYTLVGKAPLVKESRRILFIIDQAEASSGLRLKVFGVDDSLELFPPGSFSFLNFSGKPVQVKFSGSIHKLSTGQIKVVKSDAPARGGFIPFLIGDSEGGILFETRLFGQPTGRDMVFIGPSSKAGEKPKVKFLPQIIPPELPEPASQQ